jgi:hypothetical protein
MAPMQPSYSISDLSTTGHPSLNTPSPPPPMTHDNLDGAWVQVRAVGFFFTLDFHVVYEIFSL